MDFRRIIDEIVRKYAKYFDTYMRTRNECGMDAVVIFLTDAYNRLLFNVRSKIIDYDEYVDTLQELAGYCILELALQKQESTTSQMLDALRREGYLFNEDDIKIGGTD